MTFYCVSFTCFWLRRSLLSAFTGCDVLHSEDRALGLSASRSRESIDEINEAYLDVVDIIDGLFSLQSVVQCPAPHDVLANSALGVQDLSDPKEIRMKKKPKESLLQKQFRGLGIDDGTQNVIQAVEIGLVRALQPTESRTRLIIT